MNTFLARTGSNSTCFLAIKQSLSCWCVQFRGACTGSAPPLDPPLVLRLVSIILAEISAHHFELKCMGGHFFRYHPYIESTTVLSNYYFPDKSFFCLLNYHNDSSTIPITSIVKFWSASMEIISAGTMKKQSLNDCRDLISNWMPF